MIPVTQIRTGYQRGQCTEASIASVLGVPLEDVPDLWAGPDLSIEEQRPQARFDAMCRWIQERHDCTIVGVKFPETMRQWDYAYRVACNAVPDVLAVRCASWGEYHMAAGPNPDGLSHMVVCRRGALVHDPNPSRRGIVGLDWFYWLVPRVVADQVGYPEQPSMMWAPDPGEWTLEAKENP